MSVDSSELRGAPSGPARPVRVLDEALVDQIAAGEVVERPASIAKELVENALDAGAGRVRVEVRQGGNDWIAVTDDGHGMSPDSARLALERHATSKIADAEDLIRIHTFGFRGEALPAIASVSSLRLRTRARGAAEAFELRVESGRRVAERSAAGPEGTRVEVADLFAGVPARRKFLKSAVTEWGHVADWLARAALALPEIHFDLLRDGRPAQVWPAVREPLERIAAVLSEEVAAALFPIEREAAGVLVRGFASRPDRHRGTAAGIHLFVNGRPVRDRLLRHALLEVYRDLLPRGRFPTAVVFVELPGAAVDVNVHPAKLEVRFADPTAIHRLVRQTLREAIAGRSWLGAETGPAGDEARPGPVGAPWSAAADRVGEDTTGDWIFASRSESGAEAGEGGVPAPQPAEMARVRLGEQRLLGQLLATYLVLEGKQGLLLVDQHAAHERVLFEQLRSGWLEGGVERQGLLTPNPVELEPRLRLCLLEARETLRRLGFEVEPFGEGAVAVRAVPALLAGRDPVRLVRNLADELAEAGAQQAGPGLLEAAEPIFASLACHSARRKGDALDPREQRALLDAVDAIPWAPTCPHGRPVVVPIAIEEIERRFGRR